MHEVNNFSSSLLVLADYSNRHLIDSRAFRADGTLILFFDDKYRVMLRPLTQGRIVLLSTLLGLDAFPAPDRFVFLLGLMTCATGLLRDHACGLVLDESKGTLMLQQLLPAGFDVDRLEVQLADFVNILAFWHSFCQERSGRLQSWT